ATTTNSIWVFLAVLPWAIISLEETQRATALRAVLAFLGATASALSVLFLPLALGWLAYRRTRSAVVVVVCFLVGEAVQGLVALTTDNPAASPYFGGAKDVAQLRDGIGARVF